MTKKINQDSAAPAADVAEAGEWLKDKNIPCATLKTRCVTIAVGTVLMRHWPDESGRHDAALGVGGFLARAGWSLSDIEHFMDAICRETDGMEWAHDHARTAREAAEAFSGGGEARGLPWMKDFFGESVAKTIAKLVEYRGRETVEPVSGDDRPTMKVENGKLSETATLAETLLKNANVPFYERSNVLVRPIIKIVDTFHGRKTSVAQFATIDQTYMRDALSRAANWYKLDMRERRWIATDPPHDVAATVLGRSGEWTFPTVAGVITTQTMRPDGTILDQPGYDPATRLLLIDPPAMVPIPDKPTRDDALAALALLNGLLTEFPFVNEVSRGVALSTMITPVVRGAFPVAPMHVADAPVPSSGKSYLFDTAAAIAIGRAMPVIAAGTVEETEKRLGAALLTGQPLITIDNVNSELKGDALCQIIERSMPQIRSLGRSELVDVEARTTLFANGNNITIVGDLCRRVIRARLDPRMEQPELRVFTGNPMATVLENRGAYVAAALTICRSYITAGRPDLKPRLASFEGWCDTVRSALTWLGVADPVASMEMIRDEDPEKSALGALLGAWASVIGTGIANAVQLKEVIEMVNKVQIVDPRTHAVSFQYPELSTAVHAITPSRQQPDVNSLGYWIRGRKNRIVNDMWLENKTDKNGTKWWVSRRDGAEVLGSSTMM